MLTIKLKADNIKMLRKAASEQELRGAVDMVLELVAQSETLLSFGKEPKAATTSNWKAARDIMAEVLGDQLIVPPFPDSAWYQQIYRAIKTYGLDANKLREIAQYAKENLRPPYALSFLVCAHRRILAGEWNKGNTKAGTAPVWRKDVLPDD